MKVLIKQAVKNPSSVGWHKWPVRKQRMPGKVNEKNKSRCSGLRLVEYSQVKADGCVLAGDGRSNKCRNRGSQSAERPRTEVPWGSTVTKSKGKYVRCRDNVPVSTLPKRLLYLDLVLLTEKAWLELACWCLLA